MLNRQLPEVVFHGGARHAKAAHAAKWLATRVGGDPQDRAAAMLGHVVGERRSCVEPGRQTHPHGRKKRVKRHFRQCLSLDIIPSNRIEHQGHRPVN